MLNGASWSISGSCSRHHTIGRQSSLKTAPSKGGAWTFLLPEVEGTGTDAATVALPASRTLRFRPATSATSEPIWRKEESRRFRFWLIRR